MTRDFLIGQIKAKESYLCIGLDTDLNRIPAHLLKTDDPLFEFNKQIIDLTADLCVAYKPNVAFYEAAGARGWQSLKKTIDYIPKHIFTIADAKRGDIGNTSEKYAQAFFDDLNFDSVTVNPYMGYDSVVPYLNYQDKWTILLALTSNAGSEDFQQKKLASGKFLYEEVIEESKEWGDINRLMYVAGGTKTSQIAEIRKLIPAYFLLVPGVGAQGGDLQEVSKIGLNRDAGLLVNASRSIIYASNEIDFAKKAAQAAGEIQQQMSICLQSL